MEEIVDRYFGMMAGNYPVICASDEFYFFPRVRESLSFLDRVDDFDRDKIEENIGVVKGLLCELDGVDETGLALEERIDLELIRNSMLSFLREFDQIRVWQRDPAFYLKIALMGIDSAMTKPCPSKEELVRRLLSRLKAVPGLLEHMAKNLNNVPRLYAEVAHEIKSDCIGFFNFSVTQFIHRNCDGNDALLEANNEVMEPLDGVDAALERSVGDGSFLVGKDRMHQILRESYGCETSMDQLEELGKEGYSATLGELESLKNKMDLRKTWQEVYEEFRIELLSQRDLLNLYKSEVESIKGFCEERDLIGRFNHKELYIRETPVYLRALRASASYCAPVGGDVEEEAIFYISPGKEILKRPGKGPYVVDDIHREYILTTAHEAYPGHHLLDAVRGGLKSAVRRQLENPLFYEGWSCYSEHLLREEGYLQDPIQVLIGLKRDLWRYTRCILDVGLQTGGFGCDEGAEKLVELGFTPSEAMKQVKRYAMMPGYQLSYAAGKHEILRLRAIHAPRLGLKTFHNVLLTGGQLPFKWVDKMMGREN
ncbi:MAG: DUF885 domain-containing protein [Planctomycetota bacterium]|jgi:uncharacterized protein (DUF885 family)